MEVDSRKEKDEQYKKTQTIEKWLFIKELKSLIEDLPDDYWVACNEVGHLAINRLTEKEEVEFYGIVDFHWNQIDTFGREPVSTKAPSNYYSKEFAIVMSRLAILEEEQ